MNPNASKIKSVAEIASVVISGVMLTFDVINLVNKRRNGNSDAQPNS